VNYSIAAVSRLTHLSPDVLRVWERRYQMVAPARDATGARTYSEQDVARLALAGAATRLGHPIRTLARLQDDEIRALIGGPNERQEDAGRTVERLVDAARAGDAARAAQILRAAASLVPARELVLEIFAPALRRIGEEWACGRAEVWQEHLLSDLVRSAIGSSGTSGTARPILFVTPPFEPHGFGTALAAMLAGARGIRTIDLGTRVPASEAVAAATATRARAVVAGISGALPRPALARAYCEELAAGLPDAVEVWTGGPLGTRVATELQNPRVTPVESLEAFDRLIVARYQARRGVAEKSAALVRP
jgi:DNA-binding transcriptional MerR regulator/methylmalonyl-CoA mutase cobalamin-binding subunit